MNYTRKCEYCGLEFVIERSVVDRNKDTDCDCGGKSIRVFDTYTNDYKPSNSRHLPPKGYENK